MSSADLQKLFQTIKSESELSIDPTASTHIGQRYQAIFQLKNINTTDSINKLILSYKYCEGSILLTHELLYALGQLDESKLTNESNNEKSGSIKTFLLERMQDEKENGVARHQAAEALANFIEKGYDQHTQFEKHLIGLFEKYASGNAQNGSNVCEELRDTCKISLEKLRRKELKNEYGKQIVKYAGTKQPAAPYSSEDFDNFLQSQPGLADIYKKQGFLGLLLLQEKEVQNGNVEATVEENTRPKISLFEKYRIIYFMRNLGTESQINTLCLLISKKYFKTQCALLKHQICFILGQIGCGQYENLVRQCMQNDQESDIVRHQALAAIASQSKDIAYLQKFTSHENRLIRQSALVAEYTIKYWNQ